MAHKGMTLEQYIGAMEAARAAQVRRRDEYENGTLAAPVYSEELLDAEPFAGLLVLYGDALIERQTEEPAALYRLVLELLDDMIGIARAKLYARHKAVLESPQRPLDAKQLAAIRRAMQETLAIAAERVGTLRAAVHAAWDTATVEQLCAIDEEFCANGSALTGIDAEAARGETARWKAEQALVVAAEAAATPTHDAADTVPSPAAFKRDIAALDALGKSV